MYKNYFKNVLFLYDYASGLPKVTCFVYVPDESERNLLILTDYSKNE